MLKEALEYLLTPKTPLAKRYGFLYSSISLKHRFERCKKQWLPHLKNCQEIFLLALEGLPQKRSVVVLGSAHLHEIPLHLLTEHFQDITLVDLIHPLAHHRLARKNRSLKLITQDLSNTLEDLEQIDSFEGLLAITKKKKSLPFFYFDADLIISANILSQLALLPIEHTEKKLKRPLTLEEKDRVCTGFANRHIESLSACQGRKLIYSDRVVTYRSKDGEVIYEGSYPANFTGYTALKSWIWNLAPLGEASKDYAIEMKIEAFKRD